MHAPAPTAPAGASPSTTSSPAPPRSLEHLAATGALVPGRGPLLRAAPDAPTTVSALLVAAWQRGELVRLCRGTYVRREAWTALPPWERYTLAAVAYAMGHPETVFTGLTAAHLHGLPLVDTPDAVHHRALGPGHRGRRPLAGRHVIPKLADDVPSPPDRRPRWNLPVVADLEPAVVEVTLKDGAALGAVRVGPLPTVQLQLACELSFRDVAAPFDALALRHPAPAQRWAEDNVGHLPTAAARRRFQRAWEFADPRSESPGESLARALIHELGFAAPEPQRKIYGADGKEIARVDFWWPEVRVAGEFDGITKYDVGLYPDEAERQRAIRREKERELRLRRVVREVTRWTWSDLRDPDGFARELRRVGVPVR